MVTLSGNTVMSVYSGKDGSCCCGCAGKHTYASALRNASTKNRGYKVQDSEINDRTVKLIVNKIEKAGGTVDECGEFASAVVGKRLYVAYFVNAGE